jgi:hypothetical protein
MQEIPSMVEVVKMSDVRLSRFISDAREELPAAASEELRDRLAFAVEEARMRSRERQLAARGAAPAAPLGGEANRWN